MSRRHDNHERGFTLIELLVVIVILGILAGVVVFAVRGSGDKGKKAAVATDERIIRTALEVFCAAKGHYPGAPGDPGGPDPMNVLVQGKFLSSPSEIHGVVTGPNEPEGKCPGDPKHFSLTGPGSAPVTLAAAAPIDAGQYHSLALNKADTTVYAWGGNYYDQLGNGSDSNTAGFSGQQATPAQVIDPTLTDQTRVLSGVTAIAAGSFHSLALKGDGTVWAWGYNGDGQLGNGTTNWSPKPVQVLQPATSSTTVPVTGGLLPTIPANSSPFSGVIAISAGGNYGPCCGAGGQSLALKGDGTVWAWGGNSRGELGDGTTAAYRSTPVQVTNLSGHVITAISAGAGHSLALERDGTVWAWGSNGDGQLGNNTTPRSSTPVHVSNLNSVTAISAGGGVFTDNLLHGYSLALKGDGTVWAWGYNDRGELGNGTTTSTFTPVQVSNLPGVTAIAAGGFHSLALKGDGTVWAWGDGKYGQLGTGQCCAYYSSTPVQVSNLPGVTAIAAGQYHSLAVKDGSVWSWGSNDQSQLGYPPDSTTISPTAKQSGMHFT